LGICPTSFCLCPVRRALIDRILIFRFFACWMDRPILPGLPRRRVMEAAAAAVVVVAAVVAAVAAARVASGLWARPLHDPRPGRR
jgi:hypothetical protein